MDRRKLRRLLASSSFAALLVAANTVRGQDLSNPAGSTTAFLRVDPGDVFDDVFNFGLITNGAGDPGIEVIGTGRVLGEVDNEGTISLTHSTAATGILVRGASALIGDGISNDGLIDVSVSGSGTGLYAGGIVVTGTNTLITGFTEGRAVLNEPDGTIDIDLHAFSTVTASKAKATAGGLASGIFIGGDVTHSGGVFNFGVIDVAVSSTAIARGLGAAVVSAKAIATGSAYGVDITSTRLDEGFHNNGEGNGPGRGPGTINVLVDNDASALSFTSGAGDRKADAKASATGTAYGVLIDVTTITVEVFHDGVIDVDSVQNALADARVTAAGKATAGAKASANAFAEGLFVSATLLTAGADGEEGGFQGNGDVFADAIASGRAVARADPTGAGKADAKATVADVTASAFGIELYIDTITGGIENDGVVDVRAYGFADADADAFTDSGDASAKAQAQVTYATVVGFRASGTSLGGGFENRADIFADATATAIARAGAHASNGKADAKATVTSAYAYATGIDLDYDTISGDVVNDGQVVVTAKAVSVATASAVSTNNDANAKASGNPSAFVYAVQIDITTLFGSVTNTGDITAAAWAGGFTGTGGTTGVRAFASGADAAKADATVTGTASVTGLSISIASVSGGVVNEGNVLAVATGDFAVLAQAFAGSEGGTANANASDVDASVTGVYISIDTVGGDVENSGEIAAHALVRLDVSASAKSTDSDAKANAFASSVTATATGFSLNIDTLFGSVTNSGDVSVSAKVEGGDSVRAFASGADGAKATAQALTVEADVTGLYFSITTVGGDVENQGQVNALASANLAVHATALAGSEGGTAKAIAQSISATATGIYFSIDTVGGDLRNSGDVQANALLGLLVEASAKSTGSKADAKATAQSVFADAFGVFLNLDTVFGSVTNSGDINASARVAGGDSVRAFASGDEAKADAKAQSLQAFVSGLYVAATRLDGDLVNEGNIVAQASVDAAVSATAIATGKADAAAKVADVTVTAYGFYVDIDTVGGDVQNHGDIYVRAAADIVVSASAKSTGDEAKAKATAQDVSVSARGFFITNTSLLGSVTNSADVTAFALLNSGSSVKAVASGDDAKAEAKWQDVDVTVTAAVWFDLGSVGGDAVNNGTIWSQAGADIAVSAVAKAATGLADAGAKATTIAANAWGFYVSATSTIGGNIENHGDIYVAVAGSIDVFASAVGGTDAKAKASAQDISIYANAFGIQVTGTVFGSVTNSGQLTAIAALNGGSSVRAFASGDAAKAEAKLSIATASVTGFYISATSIGGSLINEGEIFARASADLRIEATASAGTGKADAKASARSLDVTAFGIYASADTVGGNFQNKGDVYAGAVLDLFVEAVASSTGSKAGAKATASAITVHASALFNPGGTVFGSITNSGNLTAVARLNGGNSVKAFATGDEAKAEAKVQTVTVSATGLYNNGSTVLGSIVNDGSVWASATGSFAITADANAGTGKADAKAKGATLAVSAFAFYNSLSTVGGNVENNGDIHAAALMDLFVNASALSTGSKADAKATAANIFAYGSGFYVGISTIDGSVTNNGDITVAARINGDDSVHAVATGTEAKADAKWQTVTASAFGFDLSVTTLGGDVVNAGNIWVSALAGIAATADANATAGKADAKAKAQDVTANVYGIFASIDTLDGSFHNNGDVTANGLVDLFVSANALSTGSSAKAKATAQNIKAEVFGIDFAGTTVFGAVTNSAQILVRADVEALISATAVGTSSSALAKAHNISAKAYGFRASGDTLIGGLSNSAFIQVVAEVDATASADATDIAKATAQNVKAKAVGFAAEDYGTLSGGIVNSGTLLVSADVFGRAVATGATNEAKAGAKATAYGMRMDAGTLHGGMLNDGTIIVDAKAIASASAPGGTEDAKADAKAYGMQLDIDSLTGNVQNDGFISVQAFASAIGSNAKAKATAYGMFAEVTNFASGSMVNNATILVAATANAPAKAFGQVIEGGATWTGALANNSDGYIDVFASDPGKASAIGMAIRGSAIVLGGIDNRGTVLAEAVATGTANARAIDLSEATGTGHTIEMLDGLLRAVTRTTAAAPSNIATAVYMADNAKADTLEWSGGLIEANIIGDQGSDNLDVFAGVDDVLNFSHLIDGLQAIDVNNATHAATPIEFRINGVVTNVSFLNVNENGTLVVGRGASINVSSYNQDPDGTVLFEIEPGNNNNGVITVNNTAFLDGAIGIRPLPGLYFDTQSYLVIDGVLNPAGGGGFDSFVDNSPLLELTSVDDVSPDVVLFVERVPFDEVPGLTENQNELSEALEDFYDPVALLGSEIGDVVGELFGLTSGEYYDALDDLHGAEYAQMAYAGFEAMEFMLGGVNQRLHDARSRSTGAGQSVSLDTQSLQYAAINADEGIQGTQLAAIGNDPDRPASVWGKGYGSWGKLDGDEEAPGYDRTTGAVVLGVDYRFDEEFVVGLAGAYAFSSMDFEDGDQGDLDFFQIGLFGSWDSGTWYVDGLVSYAFQSYETERHIDFGAIDEKATADYDGSAVQIYGEFGYQFEVGEQALITPLLGLGWTSVWTDSFTETGASGANLKVDEASYDLLATTLGVRGSLALGGWEPSLFLGWRHEFLDDHGEADLAFAAVPDSKWTVIGSDVGSDAGLVGVGVIAEISTQFEAVVDYSGQFSGSGNSHTGSIGIRLKF